MRVLFINRTSINTTPGGDTIQMQQTAKSLKEFNVEVDILESNDNLKYENYDLIHFFNITRPAEILFHLSKTDLPYVVSTIFVDYSFYTKMNSNYLRSFITKIFGTNGIEYFKTLAKHLLYKERVAYFPYFLLGQKKSIQKILKGAAFLLPNSESEILRLKQKYQTNTPYKVIPNGVNLKKFLSKDLSTRKKKNLLCIAMIEPRKNQLNLIKAIKNTEFHLTIIGSSTPNHKNYIKQCKKAAGNNVTFINGMPQKDLIKYYLASEIHILASWFETTGLVSLEASIMGCKIVVSDCGDVKDYFQNFVSYCNPDSPKSILNAIKIEHNKDFSNKLNELIDKEFNWENAARKTYSAYLKTLKLAQ